MKPDFQDDLMIYDRLRLLSASSSTHFPPFSIPPLGPKATMKPCRDNEKRHPSSMRSQPLQLLSHGALEELLHLPDAQATFRQGFLAEVAACAGSFAWLLLGQPMVLKGSCGAGTSWVSKGTEACVDSAPYLWYWSYFLVVVMWSSLGTVTIGLIAPRAHHLVLHR